MPNHPATADPLDAVQALSVRGLGPLLYRRLVERFGGWQEARRAKPSELTQLPGMGPTVARAIVRGEWQFDPEEELRVAERHDVRVITDADPAYPVGLRGMVDAPPALYVRGQLRREDAVAIGVVGSRRCSGYGDVQAERLAAGLASSGMSVVSGLARGIDAAAHRGALRAKGRTIAVLGSGLAKVYPPEHRDMAERLCTQGALVSELPMATRPRPTNFPARNRLIAGMSLGVLVVEAARRSGALITAKLAGEMGREVFAVPGDVSRPQSRGCHDLIRDGAKLVSDVRDVIDELGALRDALPNPPPEEEQEPPPAPRLNKYETRVFRALKETPRGIDEIVRETEVPVSNVSSVLLALELRGLVKQLPGKQFALRRPGDRG